MEEIHKAIQRKFPDAKISRVDKPSREIIGFHLSFEWGYGNLYFTQDLYDQQKSYIINQIDSLDRSSIDRDKIWERFSKIIRYDKGFEDFPGEDTIAFIFHDCRDNEKEEIQSAFSSSKSDLKRHAHCKCETSRLVVNVRPIAPLNTKFKLDVHCENEFCQSGSKTRSFTYH